MIFSVLDIFLQWLVGFIVVYVISNGQEFSRLVGVEEECLGILELVLVFMQLVVVVEFLFSFWVQFFGGILVDFGLGQGSLEEELELVFVVNLLFVQLLFSDEEIREELV